MWFMLNTTFSEHLGNLDSLQSSYSISYTLTGLSKASNAVSNIDKSATSFTTYLTLKSNYTWDSSSTIAATGATSCTATLSGSTLTVSVSGVTGSVGITAKATYTGSAEGDSTPSTPTTLDEIAWESLTYRDIFITNNMAPNINNNSMKSCDGTVTYADSAGSTSIVSNATSATNYVPPYSLYVSGTSSQQAKAVYALANTTEMFLASTVKVTSYTKGYCGIIFGSQFGACANAVTDGWEVYTYIGNNSAAASSASDMYIGSASSANLTGYVNNPVAIKMSIFSTKPSLEELTNLYKEYSTRLIAG